MTMNNRGKIIVCKDNCKIIDLSNNITSVIMRASRADEIGWRLDIEVLKY